MKTRVKEYYRKAKSTEIEGFIKKHPHHTRVKPARRKARHAEVRAHLAVA